MIRSLTLGAVTALSLSAIAFAADDHDHSYPEAKSIVSVGGPITEILFALGAQDRIVARDTTSTYPAMVNDLPDVGYMRRLSPEGVLSVAPDLIIARHTSGPVETMDLLREASVPIVLVHDGFSAEAVTDAIRTVGHAIGEDAQADALAGKVEAELATLAAKVAKVETKKRVMFVLSNDGGRLNVSGRDTGANGLIELAGGINVMAEDYVGYKLVNDEAVIEAKPDLVLMMTGRTDHEGRAEEILALPALAPTPAAAKGGFYSIDGAALGFGPRTAAFVTELHEVLYGADEALN
jgi:iron complex transport system substrate-binding protein